MNTLIILTAALLPAILLWIYIWKKDAQPEPTSWLIKAVLMDYYSVYHFIDSSPKRDEVLFS